MTLPHHSIDLPNRRRCEDARLRGPFDFLDNSDFLDDSRRSLQLSPLTTAIDAG